jgi:16S rRNA (guanine(966)-N(2))-methyltransferase RsmD
VRVIGGALRGRRFAAPRRGVRPTADRVRESLFALLGDVADASVLDLYAGSGALGIEALSRGANNAVFVEHSPASVSVLKRNLAELGLADRSRVLRGDALRVLRRLARERARFDLVLADPPYAAGALDPLLRELSESGVILPGGMLVVERGRRHPVPPVPGLRLVEHREYGDTVITRFAAAGEPGGRDDR